MRSFNRGRLWSRPARVAAVVAMTLAALPAATAMADTNANTDDANVGTPTGWATYSNVTPTQINDAMSAGGLRLTDIEPYDAANGRWTVTAVRNTGAYAVPGWWWYFGLTGAQVSQKLSENSARLIHIQPYIVNGATRFAAIMVNNTGAQAREWYWGFGTTSSAISSHLSSKGTRLTDIETYFEGSNKRYAFISVKNAGTDAKTWYWYLNQSAASVSTNVNNTASRIVDLERQPDGTFNTILVKRTGTDNHAWWYRYGFASIGDVLNYANQLGARLIDIETNGTGTSRRYDAVFIDNSNAATRRIRGVFGQSYLDASQAPRGIFQAYLKRINGSILVDLNANRRAETASSLKVLHLMHAMRRVQAGTDTLGSAFTYYNYPSSAPYPDGKPSNACPRPVDETAGNRKTDYNLETGLDEMMRISDNRTTRGVVLRYGFSAINATAGAIGLTNTVLRHNIGCAYFNPATGKINESTQRNDTTARDLATVWEGALRQTTLSGTARTEFFESGNPGFGASATLQSIINQEAASLGKSSTVASQFGAAVRSFGKAGSYDTCLANSTGGCGTSVIVRSGAGIMRLPAKSNGVITYRDYAFGRLVSDVPQGCSGCPSKTTYENTYGLAANELYREEVRSALTTW